MTTRTNFDTIDLPPCQVLRDLLQSESVTLPDGTTTKLKANISQLASKVLHRVVRDQGFNAALEIGMAYGVSSLSILSAFQASDSHLTSVDPYVGWPTGEQVALQHISRAGFQSAHSHIRDFSYRALPRLLLGGQTFDFIYIDGAHDFENVFVDYFYADKLLSAGGVVGFNDVGWSDVWAVVRRLRARRDYEEVDLGVAPDYRGHTVVHSAARRLLNRPRNDRFFRKIG